MPKTRKPTIAFITGDWSWGTDPLQPNGCAWYRCKLPLDELKKLEPNKTVLVIDESWLGGGASSKNAGFVCFGSPTEILDDLITSDLESTVELIARRWEGSKKLLEVVPPHCMDFVKVGGYEVFDKSKNVKSEKLTALNELMLRGTGINNYFQFGDQFLSNSFDKKCVLMPEEERINPKKMMNYLKELGYE